MAYTDHRAYESSTERTAQRHLHELGYQFITHDPRLAGTPDIVLADRRIVVQVNGCFYHRHNGCHLCRMPDRNVDYWQRKFERTLARDRHARWLFRKLRYRLLTLWECGLSQNLADKLRPALVHFIEGTEHEREIGRADLLSMPIQHSGTGGIRR